jgi:hypothetical protein
MCCKNLGFENTPKRMTMMKEGPVDGEDTYTAVPSIVFAIVFVEAEFLANVLWQHTHPHHKVATYVA